MDLKCVFFLDIWNVEYNINITMFFLNILQYNYAVLNSSY